MNNEFDDKVGIQSQEQVWTEDFTDGFAENANTSNTEQSKKNKKSSWIIPGIAISALVVVAGFVGYKKFIAKPSYSNFESPQITQQDAQPVDMNGGGNYSQNTEDQGAQSAMDSGNQQIAINGGEIQVNTGGQQIAVNDNGDIQVKTTDTQSNVGSETSAPNNNQNTFDAVAKTQGMNNNIVESERKENNQDFDSLREKINVLEQEISKIESRLSSCCNADRSNSGADDSAKRKYIGEHNNMNKRRLVHVNKKSNESSNQVDNNKKMSNNQYSVLGVISGRAWIRDQNGKSYSVTIGDLLPDGNKILSIDPVSGLVSTSSGIVSFGHGGGK